MVVTVYPFTIVIAHQILAHIMDGFLERAVAVSGGPLCFQAVEPVFHRGIVPTIPFAAQALANLMSLAMLLGPLTAILHALVRMKE